MSVVFDSDISTAHGKIHLDAVHNPKLPVTHILIKFRTSENNLMDEILRKFLNEKFIGVSVNANNAADYMLAMNNCIYVILPESKVFSFIATLYKYILTTQIKSFTIKNCIIKNQSYRKLHEDVKKGFDIVMTGKCKSTITKITGKASGFMKFIDNLNSTLAKGYPDIEIKKAPEPYYKSFDIAPTGDMGKLYFSIFFANFDFTIKGNKLIAGEEVYSAMRNHVKEYGDLVRSNVKSFLTQAGAKRTKPAANDDGGVKMKEANGRALLITNQNIKILSYLHGLTFKPLTLAEWTVDPAVVAEVKKMIK